MKAGSGLATLGIADTQGVPKGFTDTTLPLPFNSVDAVEAAFRVHGERIASVIVEPVVGNMGCVPPRPGFLEALREITARHGAPISCALWRRWGRFIRPARCLGIRWR